jgi:hypothetical protein
MTIELLQRDFIKYNIVLLLLVSWLMRCCEAPFHHPVGSNAYIHPEGVGYFYNDKEVRFSPMPSSYLNLRRRKYTPMPTSLTPRSFARRMKISSPFGIASTITIFIYPIPLFWFWMFSTPKPKERSQADPPTTSSFRLSTISQTTNNASSFSWTMLKLLIFMVAMKSRMSPQKHIFVRTAMSSTCF